VEVVARLPDEHDIDRCDAGVADDVDIALGTQGNAMEAHPGRPPGRFAGPIVDFRAPQSVNRQEAG